MASSRLEAMTPEAWSGMSFKSGTGTNVDIDQCSFEMAEVEELPDEQKQPLLLSPELVVPTLGLEAAGPSRLTVEDYRHTDPSRDRSRCQSMVRNGAWTRDRGAGYLGSL